MLLTRSPLLGNIATSLTFDLHVLGTPPAFILSQDQTLHKDPNARFFYQSEALAPDLKVHSGLRTLSYYSLVVKVPLPPVATLA